MSDNWFQSPYNNRHPKLKETTFVLTKDGSKEMSAGTIVQPLRRQYLPYSHWALDRIWSDFEHVPCYTEKYGVVLIEIQSIDFNK